MAHFCSSRSKTLHLVNTGQLKLCILPGTGLLMQYVLAACHLLSASQSTTVLWCWCCTRVGLYRFEKRFPERIYDVGIAEQHAVTFAAGLATEGITPFCTIYSSFLQRGYDQVVHDVALQNLPGEQHGRQLRHSSGLIPQRAGVQTCGTQCLCLP